MTGSFDRIRINRRNGQTLAEKWRAGPAPISGLRPRLPQSVTITDRAAVGAGGMISDRTACRLDGRLHAHMRDIGASTVEPVQPRRMNGRARQ